MFMPNMVHFLCLLSLLMLGCSTQNDCKIDLEFKANFDNCIKIAQSSLSEDDPNLHLSMSDMVRAIESLETLTEHKSTIIWSCDAFGVYASEEHFEVDRRRWQNWYQDNKCTITMGLAQQMFNTVRTPLPNYNDPQVLQNIKDKFEESVRDSARYLDSVMHVEFQTDWPENMISEFTASDI